MTPNPCTMYTLDMLREAREAYQRIITGNHVVIVIDQNGERIEYQKANIGALANYIRQMELELAQCGLLGGNVARRPLRVYF